MARRAFGKITDIAHLEAMKASKCFPEIRTLHERAIIKEKRAARVRQRQEVRRGGWKEKTYRLQGGICVYCNQKHDLSSWTVDHIIPLALGGTNERENLIGACKGCNYKKADRFYSPKNFYEEQS